MIHRNRKPNKTHRVKYKMHFPRFSVPEDWSRAAQLFIANQYKALIFPLFLFSFLNIWYYQDIRFDPINSIYFFRNNSASENK